MFGFVVFIYMYSFIKYFYDKKGCMLCFFLKIIKDNVYKKVLLIKVCVVIWIFFLFVEYVYYVYIL